MIKKSITALIFLLLIAMLPAGTIYWQSNVEDALAKVQDNDKYVFVFFTGSDWCSWCHKLTGEVFDHQEFQSYALENMEMVMLDYPKAEYQSQEQVDYNKKIQQKYEIRGYPSVIILEKNGEVAMQTGYREGGPVKYIEFIEGVLKWNATAKDGTFTDKEGQVWYKNLEYAKELAKKDGKHILVNFTGSDWCVWCKRLSSEVFTKPEFMDFAMKNLVLLHLDFPKSTSLPPGEESYNNSLAQKYGVKGFPTIFLLDGDGKTIKKLGYEAGGAIPYVANLSDLIK
jgi:disulfide reductase